MALWPFGKKNAEQVADKTPKGKPGEEAGAQESKEASQGRLSVFKRGLNKTASGFKKIFGLRGRIDEELLEELEVKMYEADFGPEMVTDLIEELRQSWKQKEIKETGEIAPFLQHKLLQRLTERHTEINRAGEKPTVIMVTGVNGTGKTTSIAKLAAWLRDRDNRVLLAASDTFRAGATEQLQIWSERINLPVVSGKDKDDPASVAYRACEKARREQFDYLIVDTAGRLHTQKNLMRELEKIQRVLSKQLPQAPHEILLVLDATCGQNALSQAEVFNEALNLTGLILAKLDGTAKGGIVVTLNNKLRIPVKFVGLGEKVEDWAEFSPGSFVSALFS